MRKRGIGRFTTVVWCGLAGLLLLAAPTLVRAEPESKAEVETGETPASLEPAGQAASPSSPPAFPLTHPWIGLAIGPAVPVEGGTVLGRFTVLGGVSLPVDSADVGLSLLVPFTFSRVRGEFLGAEYGMNMFDLGIALQLHFPKVPVVVPFISGGLGLVRFGVWVTETFEGYYRESLFGLNIRFNAGLGYAVTPEIILTFEPLVLNLYVASSGQAGLAGATEWVINFGVRYLIP